MTALASPIAHELGAIQVRAFGELTPISRPGGQGRVHRPSLIPPELGAGPVVVKLYRRAPSVVAAGVLREMVAWDSGLGREPRERLHRVAAWPLAVVYSGLMPVGIAMEDLSGRFEVPFVMPSGRRERVLLALEHLLGGDDYLRLRGLPLSLDTAMRARVGERFSEALGHLHRHGIVVSDIAPSNVLVGFGPRGPSVCLIDCDSMVFQGRQALEPVETGDWNIPAQFGQAARSRAADAYKLALVVLRLFARSDDARSIEPHERYVPIELRELLVRGLGPELANRPPAGEWQRALGALIARGDLNARYPGPVPRSRPVAAAPVAAPPLRVAPAPARRQSAPAARPAPAAGATWLRPAVVVMWLIAGTAVLALILSRLFAAAVPAQNPGSSIAYPQYYVPQSQGLGAENR